MKRAGLAAALALLGLGPAALCSAESAPSSAAPLSPAAQVTEAFVAGAASLDAQLGLLDGGPLTQALRSLALTGAPLRLLLDPAQAETRREGGGIARLTPSAQVRWLPGAGKPLRRLLAPAAQLVWRSGAEATRADGAMAGARKRFEADWSRAATGLPEAQRLEDELKGLPDPSEDVPHLSRRRDPADRGGSVESPETEAQPEPSAAPTPREGEALDLGAEQPAVQENGKDHADDPRP